MRILIEDITKAPEQFQEVHGKGIFLGSSEIATVAGLNRFQTPLQLWMRKTGRDTSDQGNFHTKLGNLMEEVVAKLFLDEKKEYVGTKNVSVYQHDTIEFATCTPDYFLFLPTASNTEALLEIKTSGAWANKDWSEGIPDYALIQLQWQLGIMNLSQGYLAALIGGKEFYIKEVPFNADVFSQLVEMGTKFVEMIKSDTAPDAKFNDKNEKNEREDKSLDPTKALKEYAPKVFLSEKDVEDLAIAFGSVQEVKTLIKEVSCYLANSKKQYKDFKAVVANFRRGNLKKGLIHFEHPINGWGYYPQWVYEKVKVSNL